MDTDQEARFRRLEQRLTRLEDHDEQAEMGALMGTQNEALRQARFLALMSMVQELCDREGVVGEQFLKHFDERVRFYHDQLLQKAEDTDANLAAQIDERGLADMPDSESYPPLFPDMDS